jgi:hypothetical protein
MANITITLDGELLKRSRIKAAELGTSVNAVIRAYLHEWAAGDRDQEKARALASLLKMSRESKAGGFKWHREELYEERIGRWTKK